jgi:hypothetical protein
MVLATVAALGAAFAARAEHPVRSCAACRSDALRYTAFAVAGPVLALNLAVTTTDVPVVALMLLSLALAERPDRTTASAAALGLACAMKPTAWPAIFVIALALRKRDGTRAALRFSGIAVAFILAATVPAIIADPMAMADNTLLFPLGLTRHLTPADSLMPGDLLARSVPDGHALAVAVVVAAGVAVMAWLIRRPPRDLRDVAPRARPGPAVRPRPRRALRLLHLPRGPRRLALPHQAPPRRPSRPPPRLPLTPSGASPFSAALLRQ